MLFARLEAKTNGANVSLPMLVTTKDVPNQIWMPLQRVFEQGSSPHEDRLVAILGEHELARVGATWALQRAWKEAGGRVVCIDGRTPSRAPQGAVRPVFERIAFKNGQSTKGRFSELAMRVARRMECEGTPILVVVHGLGRLSSHDLRRLVLLGEAATKSWAPLIVVASGPSRARKKLQSAELKNAFRIQYLGSSPAKKRPRRRHSQSDPPTHREFARALRSNQGVK